jgi:hypothetical protein
MIRRTWGDVKAILAQTAGTSGMPVTDERLREQANLAIEELMNEVDGPGVVDRWFVVATNGSLVLPPGYDRLMQITISGVPRELRSPWFQFVQYGPGIQDDERARNRFWCGPDVIHDVGEVCSMFQIPLSVGSACICDDSEDNPPGPWNIRVYGSVDEQVDGEDVYATVQGLDENGLIVRTQLSDGSGTWINGERLTITNGTGYTESVEQFSELTAFTKPDTNGYVRLTAWNGTTEIELSNYAPDETSPSYRKYYSPWLQKHQESGQCCRAVLARCRRRYVPIEEDTDVLIISNLPALKAMMIAIWKRDASALDEYAAMKVTAVDILKKEAMAYRGKSRNPALTFTRGFSVGELPAIR